MSAFLSPIPLAGPDIRHLDSSFSDSLDQGKTCCSVPSSIRTVPSSVRSDKRVRFQRSDDSARHFGVRRFFGAVFGTELEAVQLKNQVTVEKSGGTRAAREAADAERSGGMASAAAARAVGRASSRAARTLEHLNFDNLTLRTLAIDPDIDNYVRSKVRGANFSRIWPTPVRNPQLVAVSESALALIDVDPAEAQRDDFAEYFSGNKILPGAEPAAHCYCGHQFGSFSGQLGDGATMYLGEIVNEAGERWEIQFKGAGKTPYSRSADGRKVLRSSIREFLMSEAMHALGVPTTRAATVVTSDSKVVRDIFYNGNAIYEKASIVLRIAQTFLRFGSFEIFKPVDDYTGREGPSVGLEAEMLPTMLDHTVRTYFPAIWASHADDEPQARYLAWFEEVVRRTAVLVAEWQCVGFCHGVLNTDNMSVVGVTIDYGPYGMMDAYDPSYTSNGSDDQGRYAYGSQPSICRWNCEKLAEAVSFCLPLDQSLPVVETVYTETFNAHYRAKLRSKLGLIRKTLDGDNELLQSFLDTLKATRGDFTNSFRCLSRIPIPSRSGAASPTAVSSSQSSSEAETPELEGEAAAVLEYLLSQVASLEELRAEAKRRVPPQQLRLLAALAQQNPQLLKDMGVSAAWIQSELAKFDSSQSVMQLSAVDKGAADRRLWSTWLARYCERVAQEVDADTSEADVAAANTARVHTMNSANPKYVLRNYMAQNAIEKAEAGDYSAVRELLQLLQDPYVADGEDAFASRNFDQKPPSVARELVVT